MKYFRSIMTLCAIAIIASVMVFLFMKKGTGATPPPVSGDVYGKAVQELKALMWDNYVPYIVEDDYKQLPSNASFSDTTGKTYMLNDLNTGRYKLVVRYSYADCDVCVNEIMKQIKTAAAQNSIKDVFAVATSPTDRDFLIRARVTQWPVKAYSVAGGSLGLNMENKDFPFLFVLTPDNHVIKVLTPSKDMIDQIKAYLTKTLTYVNAANRNAKI